MPLHSLLPKTLVPNDAVGYYYHSMPHSRLQGTCILVLATPPTLTPVSLTFLRISGGNESLR